MKIIFAGTPDFAARHLDALITSSHDVVAVVSQPDRPGKRGKKLVPPPVKQVAEAAGLPVIQPERRLKAADLADIEADIMVVVAFGQILKKPVLEFPRLGCINVHASLLPRWRGAAPVQRAILAGDNEFGVTIIQMDEGLDTGDMLGATAFPLAADETAGSLFGKLEAEGPPLLISTLDALEAGTATHRAQSDTGQETCYAHKIEKEEAHINWHQSAITVDRSVRAFQPDPVAFSFLEDKRVRIHEGQARETEGAPGQILSVSKEGVLVGCGQGSYLITKIQLPVGKGSVLSPADVLNGFGDILHTGTGFQLRDPT